MARGFLEDKLHNLHYSYHGTGVTGVILKMARKLIAPLYTRDVQYLLIRDLNSQAAAAAINEARESSGTECMIVESAEALHAVQGEISASFRYSVADLKDCVEQGCVVFLARCPRTDGAGKEVVGYYIIQRGVFSVLGHERNISADIACGRYSEVLAAYRGQRIRPMLSRANDKYCRSKGMKKLCVTIGIHNRPSIRASLEAGSTIVGIIERVAVFGGLFSWGTPWEEIEQALRTS